MKCNKPRQSWVKFLVSNYSRLPQKFVAHLSLLLVLWFFFFVMFFVPFVWRLEFAFFSPLMLCALSHVPLLLALRGNTLLFDVEVSHWTVVDIGGKRRLIWHHLYATSTQDANSLSIQSSTSIEIDISCCNLKQKPSSIVRAKFKQNYNQGFNHFQQLAALHEHYNFCVRLVLFVFSLSTLRLIRIRYALFFRVCHFTRLSAALSCTCAKFPGAWLQRIKFNDGRKKRGKKMNVYEWRQKLSDDLKIEFCSTSITSPIRSMRREQSSQSKCKALKKATRWDLKLCEPLSSLHIFPSLLSDKRIHKTKDSRNRII